MTAAGYGPTIAPTGYTYLGHTHPAEPTPDQSRLVAEIAAILLIGGAADLTVRAIRALFRRRGVTVSDEVLTATYRLAAARTLHEPRMIGRTDVVRAQQRLEAHYRAAYLLNAAQRLQLAVEKKLAALEDRTPENLAAAILEAARLERVYERAHEKARKRRMEAAVLVADAANQYGPLCGWHTHRDDRTTPECLAAHGSNFRAAYPPVVGWPGTLHGGTCRCTPGRPFPDGPTTDEATGFA